MELRAVFEGLVDELAGHPEVEVLSASAGASPPAALAAIARRRLRFANPRLREQLVALPPLSLRWTLRRSPSADGEVPPAVGGLEVPGGDELVERLLEACARTQAPDDGRARFVGLDRWPRYAMGLVVAQGVVGPKLGLREVAGGLLTAPPMLPFDYLERVFAHRALYVLRTVEAGDPAVLGPLAPTGWRADRPLLNELLALASVSLELPDALSDAGAYPARGLSAARAPRRAQCS